MSIMDLKKKDDSPWSTTASGMKLDDDDDEIMLRFFQSHS